MGDEKLIGPYQESGTYSYYSDHHRFTLPIEYSEFGPWVTLTNLYNGTLKGEHPNDFLAGLIALRNVTELDLETKIGRVEQPPGVGRIFSLHNTFKALIYNADHVPYVGLPKVWWKHMLDWCPVEDPNKVEITGHGDYFTVRFFKEAKSWYPLIY